MIVDVSRLRLTIHTMDGAENDDSVLSSLIHSSSLVIFCVFRRTSSMSLTYYCMFARFMYAALG